MATGEPMSYADKQASASVDAQSLSDGSVQMDELSIQVVTLYQRQSGLTDKLWHDFGRFSAMAMLMALLAPIAVKQDWLPARSPLTIALFAMTFFVYVAFSVGNRMALEVAQNALERIAGQAQMASKITLEVIRPRSAVFFQSVLSTLIMFMLFVGLYFAYTNEGPQDKARALQTPTVPAAIAAPPSSSASSTR